MGRRQQHQLLVQPNVGKQKQTFDIASTQVWAQLAGGRLSPLSVISFVFVVETTIPSLPVNIDRGILS
ncbi:MAG: hypothetical protein GY768_33245 [Planctomycetaceae bacterium]|nr:hypothetical protein [Planctomycetaceae bacterium]